MNILQTFFRSASWQSLVVIIVLFTVGVMSSVGYVLMFTDSILFLGLLFLGVGVFSILTGYIVAKQSDYELVPQPRQVYGALLNGVMISVLLYSGTQFFIVSPVQATAIILFLSSVLIFVEFLSVRIGQNKKVSVSQLVALVFVIGALVYYVNGLSQNEQTYVLTFLLAGFCMECISRFTKTYLLSPWVSSFWNGLPIVLIGLFALPAFFSLSLSEMLIDVAHMPFWLGCVVVLLGISVVMLRFLKHKFRISKGYMQYKLQTLTLLFGVGTALVISQVQFETIGVFLLITIAFAIAEGRLIIKE